MCSSHFLPLSFLEDFFDLRRKSFLNWYSLQTACIAAAALFCFLSSSCFLASSSSASRRSSIMARYCFSNISKRVWSLARSFLFASYMRVWRSYSSWANKQNTLNGHWTNWKWSTFWIVKSWNCTNWVLSTNRLLRHGLHWNHLQAHPHPVPSKWHKGQASVRQPSITSVNKEELFRSHYH